MEAPRTRFATSDDVRVAYQVMGTGPCDLVLFPDGSIPMEAMLEEPSYARFVARLASFSRLIRFDRRGMGLSDPISPTTPPTLEQWADDALAVMDTIGSGRAALLGLAEGGLVATTLAARRPDRVACLILVNATPGETVLFDDPSAILPAHRELEAHIDEVWEDDEEIMGGAIAAFAPSAAGDPRYRAWLTRAVRRSMSPTMMRAFFRVFYRSDIRGLLPLVAAPTLVVHREGNTYLAPAHGQYFADHIPGARYVEVPGADHVVYLGDTAPILDEIEMFATGGRAGAAQTVATVLFTDIVGSTERASQLGDRQWRELLDAHDLVIRRLLGRHGGWEVKSTGDGVLATFDDPLAAVCCACEIRTELRRLSIEIRAGLHCGEVEERGEDIAGLTVNIAARIEALSTPGEVLASDDVRAAVEGRPGITFVDRGRHGLKGVPGTWPLFAVEEQVASR